jgi:hypothetical protein
MGMDCYPPTALEHETQYDRWNAGTSYHIHADIQEDMVSDATGDQDECQPKNEYNPWWENVYHKSHASK